MKNYERKLSPYYWIFNRKKEFFLFRLSLFFYKIKQAFSEKRQGIAILLEIFISTMKPALFALIIIIFLEMVESWATSRVTMLSQYIPLFIERFIEKMSLNQDSYANFVGVMAQLSGVFLGLYFTAISLLFSTMYARVPEEIRKLLLSEKIGNQYIKVVIHFGAVSILLFFTNVIGISLGFVNLIYASMLSLLTMLSFAMLGLRSFHFFNPTNLVNHMIPDLLRWIQSATSSGLYWNNPSYQSHYQREAERLLETNNKICCLGKIDEFKFIDGYSLKLLGQYGLRILSLYIKNKNNIPGSSLWFKKKYEHPSWFTTNYSELNVRLKTHTPLSVKELPNYLWFEEKVVYSLIATLQTLLERQDHQHVAELAPMVFETLKIYGYHLASDEGLLILSSFSDIIQSHLCESVNIVNIDTDEKVEETLLLLAVAETSCYSFIGLLLGISEKIDSLSKETFDELIPKLDWSNSKSIYSYNLPRCVTQQLETLQKGLEFEYKVEGKVITPQWYVRQIAALGLVRYANSVVSELVKWFELNLVKNIELWLKEERYILVLHLLQRGFEVLEKLNSHFKSMKNNIDSLSSLRVVSDIPWPSPQWGDINNKLESFEERLYISLAQAYPLIVKISHNRKLPDYVGYSYTLLIEKAIYSLQIRNENLFKVIITTLINTFHLTRAKLLQDFAGLSDKEKSILLSEQIIDLLEISGLAYVYSELDDKKHWEIARSSWDALFKSVAKEVDFAQLLVKTVDYYKSQFAMYPKSIVRTEWKTMLRHKGMEMGLLRHERYGPRIYDHREETMAHPNPVIRELFNGSDIYYDAADVFFIVYLMERPEAKEIVFENSTISFARSVHGDDLEEPLHV